jgi:hypothetical protein
MGYMQHHAILVTTWDDTDNGVAAAHREAERCMPGLVSPIITGWVNGYSSFFIAPDGSKEGWEDSDKGDAGRADFIRWIRSQDYDDGSNRFTWALVQFGDDDEDNRLLAGTDIDPFPAVPAVP